jgi:hypothetical protein
MHATAARRPALHARTHTRTHAHTAPRLRHSSVHTTRAQRLPPGPPAHAMPRLLGGTRPARAQRPSPGARARALHRLPLADRHPAPGGGGGGGGGTATHRRPLRSRAGRRKGWPLGTPCCPVGSSHAPGAALTATKSCSTSGRVAAAYGVVVVVSELHGPRRIAASGARTARGKKPPVATR